MYSPFRTNGVFENCTEKKCCDFLKDPSTADKCLIEWSYDSWTKNYKYYCDKANDRTLGKALVLLISTLVCFSILFLADRLGRRTVVRLSSVIIILGCICTFAVPDLFWKMVAIGFAAGAEGAFSALFSILINEATSE